MRLNSYPKIYNLGHAAIADMLLTPVVVEEKVDGSQFSFGVTEDGEIHARSKGAELHVNAPDGMFANGVRAVVAAKGLLRPGWTYRGEYLMRPKHNVLAYERTPKNHVILFDINSGLETYLPPAERAAEAARIGFESVPVLHEGLVPDLQFFRGLLDRVSVLGGQKIEGVVIKPAGYGLWGEDKKCLMGKFVSEEFKEVHAAEWKEANPTQNDIVDRLAYEYRTPARWAKAMQRLAEAGRLENSPRDIGLLIKEVPDDVLAECRAEIEGKLMAWAWPHVRRKILGGLPEWYKDQLLKRQFDAGPSPSEGDPRP